MSRCECTHMYIKKWQETEICSGFNRTGQNSSVGSLENDSALVPRLSTCLSRVMSVALLSVDDADLISEVGTLTGYPQHIGLDDTGVLVVSSSL